MDSRHLILERRLLIYRKPPTGPADAGPGLYLNIATTARDSYPVLKGRRRMFAHGPDTVLHNYRLKRSSLAGGYGECHL